MSEWATKSIGKELKITSGFSFSSGLFSNEEGFPLIRIRDILQSNIETYYRGAFLPTYIVRKGDVLIGMDGDFHVARWCNADGLLNQRVLKIEVLDEKSIDLDFVFYWLAPYIKKINEITAATTVKHLSIKDIVKATAYVPDVITQRKIAAILTRIDTAIEKTESLIAKYQKIKAGLMHDLFTRGVTADGKLRPPREQAPELYQETPVGWIPVGWDCEELQNLLAPVANNLRSGPFGSALLKSELVEEGIPFLGIDNIFSERFEGNFRRFIPARKYLELNRYAVRPNDVVITIMGTVGRCCVLPENIGLALSSKHFWTMTFDEKKVLPELVCWQLNYAPWVLAWFRRQSQGAVMDAIQSSTLRTLRLPVPDINEQKLILKRYLTCHSKITSEQNKLEKLKKQKAGLMQDLLTGKVPVKVDEPDQEFA